MESSDIKVIFTVDPAIEFVFALNFIANEEACFKRFSDLNYTPDEEFNQVLEDIKSRLSRFIKSELEYFFNWNDMEHILFNIIEDSSSVQDVPGFIRHMEQMSEEKLLSYIICHALIDTAADIPDLKKLIAAADGKTDEEKEKLMECVDNPSEVKTRLCFLMTQFYDKCYKPVESVLLNTLTDAKDRYEGSYHKDPDYFNNEYLGKLPQLGYKNLIIHMSYFTQVRNWVFDFKPMNKPQWVSLGVRSEEYPRTEFIRSRVQKFIKILSDKKRFEMVELLAKRPHYVYELSTELELTSPTVCYHLNSMLEMNLVSMDKGNNRTFYSLKKDTVKELLDNAAEILLETR